MTAKPQQMAGQSDASDDLIAELAKLMAQDAKGDEPAAKPGATFPVRIPGGDVAAAPAPVPRFGFERATAAAAAAPRPAPVAPAPVSMPPLASTPPTQEAAADPFDFDFELSAPKAPSSAVPVRPAAAPVQPPRDPDFTPVDHDSIADLIAAELLGDSEPQPSAPVQQSTRPAPEPMAPPRAAPPAQSDTAHADAWAPTPVAAPPPQADRTMRPVLRPLDLKPVAPVRQEQDRFKVAPVFGLASGRPAEAAPVVSSPAPQAQPASMRAEPSFAAPAADSAGLGNDPIDDIENLIGRAIQMGNEPTLTPPQRAERVAPSPALRSLATPVAPPSAPAGRTVSGADEAILAAAEAAGVNIGWVDPEQAPAPTRQRPERAPRAIGMTRALAGPLVAITLLLAAGFGLYWVLGLGNESGPPPLLTADTTPVKETPVAEATTEPAQSVVFNEIDGVVPGAEEQLVSRDQAVNEVTQVPASTELSEEGLANRKVRTVTVRPDGTIVSGDDTVAGSNILPVDRPEVPEVPGAEPASPELLAAAAAPAATPAVEPATTPPVTPVTPEVVPVTPGATVPAVDLTGNPLPGKTTVIPRTRPAGLVGSASPSTAAPTSSVNAVGASGNLLPPPPANNTLGLSAPAAASITPAAQQVAATASTAGAAAPAYAQLASLRTEDEARAAAQNMVTRFGPVFGGASLEVQRVDLGARGIYYRVRVPASSLQDANTICTNIVAAGGDCVPM